MLAHRSGRIRSAALVAALLASSCTGPSRRVAVIEENDLFSSGAGKDRDYSQGLRVVAEARPGGWVEGLANRLLPPRPVVEPDAGDPARAHSAELIRSDARLEVEQRIYNPEDLDAVDFVSDERPYLGILTLGIARRTVRLDPDSERRDDRFSDLGIAIGVTGPPSLGEAFQRGTHALLSEADPQGWDNQIGAEPVVQLAWTEGRRAGFGRLGGFEWDALGSAGLRAGTAFSDLGVGLDLRLGPDLTRDRRPWIDPAPPWLWWLESGLHGKWVLHDISVDGSLFSNEDPTIRLEPEPLVGRWHLGFVVERHGFRFAYRFVKRTLAYTEERGQHDWGSIELGYRYTF
jgi:lipid A 3-O-deacylase